MATKAPAASRRSPARMLHPLLVAAMWGVFIWSWARVVRGATASDVVDTMILVASILLVVVVLTMLWVGHNVSIYRKKGPRRSLATVEFTCDRDFLGREIEAEWALIAASQVVEVEIVEGRKILAADAPARLLQDGPGLRESA